MISPNTAPPQTHDPADSSPPYRDALTEQLRVWPDSEPDAGSAFRSIHYLGSKLRVLEPIASALDELDPQRGTLCDLFTGSGPVARSQASVRDVVAVDIQEYSRVLASALLRAKPAKDIRLDSFVEESKRSSLHESLSWALEPLILRENEAISATESGDDPSLLANVVEHGSIRAAIQEQNGTRETREAWRRLGELELAESHRSALSATYGGVYFSYAQAIALDSLRDAARRLRPNEIDLVLAAILCTSSELVASVGNHFAQPIRVRTSTNDLKMSAVTKVARLRRQFVWPLAARWITRYSELEAVEGNHRAIRMDYREFLSSYEGDLSVIYADPPYTRDHYSRFYHVLETIALGDLPDLERRNRHGIALSRGLYRAGRHQSPFCIHSQARQAFEELFAAASSRRAAICLSYSPPDATTEARPRVLSIDDITAIAHRYFPRIRL